MKLYVRFFGAIDDVHHQVIKILYLYILSLTDVFQGIQVALGCEASENLQMI